MKKKSSQSSKVLPLLRFAHPFFESPEARPKTPFGVRMLDHIQGTLEPIPKPLRDPEFQLSEVIGASSVAEIEANGSIQFHTAGDTGLPSNPSETPQEMVAAAMASDFDLTHPARCPAFFFHLGDVIYGPLKDQNYRVQFYEPYKHYPGKIIAIPGNHDGEAFPGTDPVSLKAFLDNFCAPTAVVPPIAGSIFRQTMTQPGPYWLLDAPFIQIIGLYSNSAENPGFISGTIPGAAQKTWLLAALQKIAKARQTGSRKALAFATHHPPFSSGGHSGSSAMLAEIDSICALAGIFPDIFFSGHSHSYQRYTRSLAQGASQIEIPFVVVGCGGHGDQPIPAATGQTTGERRFDASYRGYGYAVVTVNRKTLSVVFNSVANDVKSRFDGLSLDLPSRRVTKL